MRSRSRSRSQTQSHRTQPIAITVPFGNESFYDDCSLRKQEIHILDAVIDAFPDTLESLGMEIHNTLQENLPTRSGNRE